MKKLRILTFVLLLLSVHSCKPWSGASDECKTFLQGLHDDWTYLKERQIYAVRAQDGRINKGFVTDLLFDKKDCWKGMPAKHVRKIFGEPSKIEGNRWRYFISEGCRDPHPKNCQDFFMEVDPEKELVSIELGAFGEEE